MKKQLDQVLEFHKKFKALINNEPSNISEDRYYLRYKLMKEEIEEYLIWAKNWDKENIAKELSDILYSVYWTIIEHWLQEKIEECFNEVHKSNMSKDYSSTKMIKWKNYFKADLSNIINNL